MTFHYIVNRPLFELCELGLPFVIDGLVEELVEVERVVGQEVHGVALQASNATIGGDELRKHLPGNTWC